MYIHSYQIHNVLNDYRKQLSHGPRNNSGKHPSAMEANDRISISTDGQRQSIMEKISTEIVARIAEGGPQNQFEAALADRLSEQTAREGVSAAGDAPEFKYTVIDEHNRKKTNTLTMQGINPSFQKTESSAGDDNGKNTVPETDQTIRKV